MTVDGRSTDTDGVAPDGSPVDVYLAIPPEYGFEAVVPSIEPGSTVLDLGCGVGRLATLLVDRRCTVTGVDESPAMLAEVDPRVERVEATISDLHLARRFDVVVVASYLVNTADDTARRDLLRVAAAQVAPTGRVLLEHHHPATLDAPSPRTATIGPVEVTFTAHARHGDVLEAAVHYRLGGRRWVQRVTTKVLDLEGLERELAAVGLSPTRSLSPTWLEATPAAG